jgi:1-acyl-sn-glycerol-3-phosphate acyltransferase
MSFLKNIINWIYSAWCMVLLFLVFFFLMFAYGAFFFLNDRTRTLAAYRANRALSWVWLKMCGYSLEIEGWEKVAPTGTYMFVANHTNMLDLPVTGFFLQHYYKSLVKKELKYVPVFGFLLRVTSVAVDRSNPESRKHSTQTIVDALRRGISFMIFPEGTRNKTDQPLKSFYSGAFKTAIMAQAPIVPMVYLGHRYLQPVKGYRFYPGHIRVRILDPIETKGMVYEQAQELQDRVYKLIEDTILREDKNYKAPKPAKGRAVSFSQL